MKNISRKTFRYAHIGVVVYHLLTAVFLIISQDTKGGYLWKKQKTVVLILAFLLLTVSVLSLIPIMKPQEYTITSESGK